MKSARFVTVDRTLGIDWMPDRLPVLVGPAVAVTMPLDEEHR
jgi:hypothetical protein